MIKDTPVISMTTFENIIIQYRTPIINASKVKDIRLNFEKCRKTVIDKIKMKKYLYSFDMICVYCQGVNHKAYGIKLSKISKVVANGFQSNKTSPFILFLENIL